LLLDQNGYHDLPPGKIAAVTTHLEMRERPPARPAPPRPDLALRRVERADPAWYRDLYRRIGGDWLWFSRLLMADAELAAVLRHPGVELWALERAGGPAVGILELDRREPGQVELAFFGLVADEVGGGAGRLLMNHAIERAFAPAPIERFWVHTCTLDHPKALEFYVRSGFVPYKRSVEVADDPRLAGVLPRTVAPWLPVIG
jgi:GNAT superfamily N-acetyltransferase